jgi:hypothetical protein
VPVHESGCYIYDSEHRMRDPPEWINDRPFARNRLAHAKKGLQIVNGAKFADIQIHSGVIVSGQDRTLGVPQRPVLKAEGVLKDRVAKEFRDFLAGDQNFGGVEGADLTLSSNVDLYSTRMFSRNRLQNSSTSSNVRSEMASRRACDPIKASSPLQSPTPATAPPPPAWAPPSLGPWRRRSWGRE